MILLMLAPLVNSCSRFHLNFKKFGLILILNQWRCRLQLKNISKSPVSASQKSTEHIDSSKKLTFYLSSHYGSWSNLIPMFLRDSIGKRGEENGRTFEKQMVISPLFLQLMVRFRYHVRNSKILGHLHVTSARQHGLATHETMSCQISKFFLHAVQSNTTVRSRNQIKLSILLFGH